MQVDRCWLFVECLARQQPATINEQRYIMEIDKTTLNDLSIFDIEEEFSVFHKINLCRTSGGKEQLFRCFNNPLNTIEAITGVQQTLQLILKNEQYWPAQITNGTIMVIEKFYQSVVDEIPSRPSALSAYVYKLLHNPDFSLVKYSAEHCFESIIGCRTDHRKRTIYHHPTKRIGQRIKCCRIIKSCLLYPQSLQTKYA
jgi:hypothetical protein